VIESWNIYDPLSWFAIAKYVPVAICNELLHMLDCSSVKCQMCCRCML